MNKQNVLNKTRLITTNIKLLDIYSHVLCFQFVFFSRSNMFGLWLLFIAHCLYCWFIVLLFSLLRLLILNIQMLLLVFHNSIFFLKFQLRRFQINSIKTYSNQWVSFQFLYCISSIRSVQFIIALANYLFYSPQQQIRFFFCVFLSTDTNLYLSCVLFT